MGNEADALDVLSEILGGGTTSLLYQQLVLGKGVAISAGAGYGPGAIDDTSFSIYAMPRGDVTLETLAGDIHRRSGG